MGEKDEKNKALTQFTCKVYPEVKEELGELMNSGSFSTANQMMETLIETYNFPKKANSANEKIIAELKTKNETLTANYDKLLVDFQAMENDLQQANSGNNSHSEEIATLKEQLQAAKSNIPGDDVMLIPITDYDRAVLQWMCDRENKKRKRTDLTPEIFLMFTIDELLVKGHKFTIDCVPDSVLRKIEKELNAEQE